MDHRQRWIGSILLCLVVVGMAALGARLAYINAAMRPRLAQVGKKQREGFVVLPSRRGMIFDCRGRVVALSRHSHHESMFQRKTSCGESNVALNRNMLCSHLRSIQ